LLRIMLVDGVKTRYTGSQENNLMAQIFAIKNTKAFTSNPFFQRIPGGLDDSACIVISSMEEIDGLVGSGVIEAISSQSYTPEERTAFIREYTGFIASLNVKYKDKFLWWATDLSSKNRYVCPLPDLLGELLEIDRGLKLSPQAPLLIITSSIGIYRALKKAVSRRGRKLYWPQAPVKEFEQCMRGWVFSFFKLVIRALRFYARSFWARLRLKQYARRWLNTDKKFYVIKTFSYPNSWDKEGVYTDSFFGRLPRILSKDNDVLILTYHWQGFKSFIKRVSLEKTLALFPVEFFLKGKDVLRAVFRILIFKIPVESQENFHGLDVSDILRFELARTMNGVQVFQLLHYDAMRNMFKKLRVGSFLFTFENNPWERMCMLACRHHSPSTGQVGYQHSVVPEAALNMFVHPLEKNIVPLPHRVLTTGEIPKNIMQLFGDYSLVSVMSACALRYEYLNRVMPTPWQKSQGRILLVLDGVEQTQLMLKFVLNQLGGHGHYQVRIRCHPALPWELLSVKFHFDIKKYANVGISKLTLQEDLAWSDMIIYWQTTVVLEAMKMGKPAINFKTRDILSYDPLFKTDVLKWTVGEHDRLLDTIGTIEDMDENSYQKQLARAQSYINQYFHPESPSALGLFRFDSQKVVH